MDDTARSPGSPVQELSRLSAASIFLVFSTILFLSIATVHLLQRPKKKPLRLPPSPPTLPIIGNLHQLSSLPHLPLRDLSKKFGQVMTVYLGQVPSIVVSSAASAKEVLQNQDLVFATRPITAVSSALTYDGTNVSFAQYGDRWRQAKKFTVVHLLSSAKVQSYKQTRQEEIADMVKKIAAKSSPFTVNLSEILHQLSSGMICRAVAGNCEHKEERNRRFRELIDMATSIISGPRMEALFPSMAWVRKIPGMNSRLKELNRKHDELLEEILKEHMNRFEKEGHNSKEADFIDLLITSDSGFSRNEIKAIFMDMIAAGTDTSYVVLDWAMSEIVRNPVLMEKIKREVRTAVAGKATVAEEDIDAMPLLRAVVKEVLRFHMPAPLLVPRMAMRDTIIQGYEVPSGTQVIVNAWAIARDEESWDSPEEFQPERFLKGDAPDYLGNDMHFLPFGAGRRICPGIGFGLCEVHLALAVLLYHFDWALPGGKAPEELDMAEVMGITVRRKTPLILLATPSTVGI
ncbi:cytochrome P450 71A1-like [Wolffia australiana]